MIEITFDRLEPTPVLKGSFLAVNLNDFEWDSDSKFVNEFKLELKQALNGIQKGKCCYCRRRMYDSVALEHYLEKASYRTFTFEVTNLALSCNRCNSKKNGIFTSHQAAMKRIAIAQGIDTTGYSPWINRKYDSTKSYQQQDFSLLHPHYHYYSQHLNIHKGWIYKPSTQLGTRTRDDLKLNEIAKIETDKMTMRIFEKRTKTSRMLALASVALDGEFKFNQVIKAITKVVKTKQIKDNQLQITKKI